MSEQHEGGEICAVEAGAVRSIINDFASFVDVQNKVYDLKANGMVLNEDGAQKAAVNEKLVGELMELYNTVMVMNEVQGITEKGKEVEAPAAFEKLTQKMAEVSKIKMQANDKVKIEKDV